MTLSILGLGLTSQVSQVLRQGHSLCVCHLSEVVCLQENEERKREETELVRLRQDRGEGEEVSLGTAGRTEREERSQPQGMELHLHGDEESEDSDDDCVGWRVKETQSHFRTTYTIRIDKHDSL